MWVKVETEEENKIGGELAFDYGKWVGWENFRAREGIFLGDLS